MEAAFLGHQENNYKECCAIYIETSRKQILDKQEEACMEKIT